MTLREHLRAALTQPHWTRNQPLGVIHASLSDLTTDIIDAIDAWLKEQGYEALRKLLRS